MLLVSLCFLSGSPVDVSESPGKLRLWKKDAKKREKKTLRFILQGKNKHVVLRSKGSYFKTAVHWTSWSCSFLAFGIFLFCHFKICRFLSSYLEVARFSEKRKKIIFVCRWRILQYTPDSTHTFCVFSPWDTKILFSILALLFLWCSESCQYRITLWVKWQVTFGTEMWVWKGEESDFHVHNFFPLLKK